MESLNKKILEKMNQAFLEIQMPRTPYVLDKLVVNTKFTEEQKYAQCVLEMSITYDNLRTARCNMELKQIEIDEMTGTDRKTELNKAIKEIELEWFQRTVLWAEREFEYLFKLRRWFKKQYTREDLNNASPLEYKLRLETQALHDLESSGKISVSNLEWLRQIELPTNMLWVKQRDEIEERYLEEWKLRAKIIIPSEHRLAAVQIDELLGKLILPSNIEIWIENISESPVADNYNSWFEKAIKEWCTHVVTIEDDQVLNPESLIKLFDFALENPNACVWAWYPKRQKVRQGVHITLKWWHRSFLEDDWKIHELKTLAMGLSIYPVEILNKIDFPRCKTTNSLSQDSYLSQKIRDAWYKLLCDTNIKIWHKDRDWEIYF